MRDANREACPVSVDAADKPDKPSVIRGACRWLLASELFRYIVNGLTSTAVHFLALLAGIHVFEFQSIGVANAVAAVFGSSCSFLGNRYFVFRNSRRSIGAHLTAFAAVYAAAAAFHGAFLYVWSDVYGWHYAIGFLIATVIQTVLVYLCNRTMVFK